MANLMAALTDTKLRIQKDVVKNEYRQNYANRPYGSVSPLIAEALYPPQHPYSWIAIGVMEDVEPRARLAELMRLYRSLVKRGLLERVGPRGCAAFFASYVRGDRALRRALRAGMGRERLRLALHGLHYRRA